jgi:hypothetical protein
MPKADKTNAIWNPDFSKAPKGTIGATFNPDGSAWWWSVKPEVKGSEEKPWLLLWRGPVAREGYTRMGSVSADVHKGLWKDSWIPNPKAGK